MPSFNFKAAAFARESISVTSGAVVSLSPTIYDPASTTAKGNQMPVGYGKARAARIAVRIADINFTEDGTTPTTTTTGTGTPAGDRDVISLETHQAIANFKAIAQTAANATLEVTYYR